VESVVTIIGLPKVTLNTTLQGAVLDAFFSVSFQTLCKEVMLRRSRSWLVQFLKIFIRTRPPKNLLHPCGVISRKIWG